LILDADHSDSSDVGRVPKGSSATRETFQSEWETAARYAWQSPDHLLDGVSPCAASGSSIELGQHLTDDLRRLVSGERVAAFRLCDLSGKVFD